MSDVYKETIARLEPNIAMIDAGAFNGSAAISLKRIADALEMPKASQLIKAVAANGVFICYFETMEIAKQVAKDLAPLYGNIRLVEP